MIRQKYNFSVIKSRFYDFSVQHGFLEVIAFVGKFQGKEGGFFIDEFEENLVAFPHCQLQKAFFLYPFEVALVAYNLVSSPVGAHEEVHMFAFPNVGDEGDDTAVAPLGDGEASLFEYLTQHTVLWALPFFELAAHAEPLVVVEVVLFFGTVKHKVLVTVFQIA